MMKTTEKPEAATTIDETTPLLTIPTSSSNGTRPNTDVENGGTQPQATCTVDKIM